MRRVWLKKLDSNDTWDLLPQNRFGYYDPTVRGCSFINIKGLGFQQSITLNQVDDEYFVSETLSKNIPITGTMLFDEDGIKQFQEFVGDFRNQLYFYYSPDGKFQAGDQISAPFYKRVIVTQFDKGEMSVYGDYEITVTLTPQDNLWSRDIYHSIEGLSIVGEALVYPYTYPYTLGGREALAIELENNGREVGCIVKIKNNTDSNLSNIEWYIERDYIDEYNVLHEHADPQRSKWNLALPAHSELSVDSNPRTQEAKVTYTDETSQSVVSLQEPDWNYINFIRVPHGSCRIVFYIEYDNIDITFGYREQKEVI